MLESLNPRKHLAAGIGWAVFIIIALAAPLCAWVVAKETENNIRQSATQSLQQNAIQIQREVAANLDSRLSVIRLAAAQMSQISQNSAELQITLTSIHRQYPEINWIGLADISGTVTAAAHNVLVGENVADEEWFKNGWTDAYMGDVRDALSLQKLLPQRSSGNTYKVIDVAVPVTDRAGTRTGVLACLLYTSDAAAE